MYRCFKLDISESDFFDLLPAAKATWKRIGVERKNEQKLLIDDFLETVTNAEGVIDGEQLSRVWFPIDRYDIFLSYSHTDEDLAMLLVGFLENVFKLKVFMDALVWNSADDLLKVIDNKYCLQEDKKHYDYRKRNFSTSHVHSMLSTAIAKAIDHSEVVFFLNTSNSTYKLKDFFTREHTLSPWIYQEILFSSLLRVREWKEHRSKELFEHTAFQHDLAVAYKIPLDHFEIINYYDLVNWNHAWTEKTSKKKSTYADLFEDKDEKHPLNVLYKYVEGRAD